MAKYKYADPDNGAREAQKLLKQQIISLLEREDIVLLLVEYNDLDDDEQEICIKYAEIEE